MVVAPIFFVEIDIGGLPALYAFSASIIGGFGSIPGVIVGGLSLGLVEIFTAAAIEASWREGIENFIGSGSKKRSWWRLAVDVMKEPMLLLLLGAGLLYFIVGDPREAAVLLSFVVVVIGIEVWQERKTENALDALRDLSSPRALVVRGGVQRRVAGRDVVVGDIAVCAFQII